MSTRSIIIIKAQDSISRLYRHCDGYPTAQLPVISAAFRATNFKATHGHGLLFADALIDVAEGMGGRIQREDFRAGSNLEILPSDVGSQTDLEWIYVVDLVNHNVSVFEGSWDVGGNFQTISRDMMSDPQNYALKMREEFQERERASIVKSVLSFGPLGVTVNRPVDGTTKEKQERSIKMQKRAKLDEITKLMDVIVTKLTWNQYTIAKELAGQGTPRYTVESQFLAIGRVSKSEKIHAMLRHGLKLLEEVSELNRSITQEPKDTLKLVVNNG